MKNSKKILLAGTVLAGMTAVNANTNIYNASDLGSGSELRSNLLSEFNSSALNNTNIVGSIEAKCGEGKCGEKSTKSESSEKSSEAKCGEGKCGEGKCGEKSEKKTCTKDKTSESKCGEGKCGEKSETKDKTSESKCGEGKCGSK